MSGRGRIRIMCARPGLWLIAWGLFLFPASTLALEQATRLLTGHTNDVLAVAFSPTAVSSPPPAPIKPFDSGNPIPAAISACCATTWERCTPSPFPRTARFLPQAAPIRQFASGRFHPAGSGWPSPPPLALSVR